MKWIGQHIYDLVSRFRNDIYLESLSSSSETDTLVVDSNGKITKNTSLGGDITSVIGGTNCTVSGGTSGDATVNVDDAFLVNDASDTTTGTITAGGFTTAGTLTLDSVGLTAVQTSAELAEGFGDNDTSLLTSAAIDDRILSYGYSTTTGDITGVTITTDSGGGSAASDTAGSADFSILGTSGVGVTNSGTTITATSVPGEIDHDSLLNFASNEHFTQANITTVGTIDTGVWNGTAVASAYLDSDTAHLTTAQTFTGVKTIGTNVKLQFRDANAYINSPDSNDLEIAATDITLDAAGIIKLEGPVRPTGQLQYTYHNFTDDIDTTKIYLSLADADTEGTATTAIKLPFTAPLAGKLMRIFLRANQNLSGKTLTWRLETQGSAVTFGTGPTIVGTQSGAGCNTTGMTTYDFTSSLDSGDNIIDAGDVVYLSIQSDAATANTKFYVTCLWEWDMSSIG